MSYESPQPAHEAVEWESSVERFAVLTPNEVVALIRQSSGGDFAAAEYTETLPRQDLDRAKDVYLAFAQSPLGEDRRRLSFGDIAQLTLVDHDAGLELWDQLIRDVDPDVRCTVVRQLDEDISNAGARSLDPDDSDRLTIYMRRLARPDLDAMAFPCGSEAWSGSLRSLMSYDTILLRER